MSERKEWFVSFLMLLFFGGLVILSTNIQKFRIEKLEVQVSELESRTSAKLEAQKLGAAKLAARQRSEASLKREEPSPACLP